VQTHGLSVEFLRKCRAYVSQSTQSNSFINSDLYLEENIALLKKPRKKRKEASLNAVLVVIIT
jgi:hypothetical protein